MNSTYRRGVIFTLAAVLFLSTGLANLAKADTFTASWEDMSLNSDLWTVDNPGVGDISFEDSMPYYNQPVLVLTPNDAQQAPQIESVQTFDSSANGAHISFDALWTTPTSEGAAWGIQNDNWSTYTGFMVLSGKIASFICNTEYTSNVNAFDEQGHHFTIDTDSDGNTVLKVDGTVYASASGCAMSNGHLLMQAGVDGSITVGNINVTN